MPAFIEVTQIERDPVTGKFGEPGCLKKKITLNTSVIMGVHEAELQGGGSVTVLLKKSTPYDTVRCVVEESKDQIDELLRTARCGAKGARSGDWWNS